MNEQQLRTRLRWHGADHDETEDAIADWASDAYDREQDRKAEEYFATDDERSYGPRK